MVDFPSRVLRLLQIGDRIQIHSFGLGMRLLDYPEIVVTSCSPRLLAAWGIRAEGPRLNVPVTHFIPASIMGSGIGRPDSVRGDYDIQLFDPVIRNRFGLGSLRFGDIVAIIHSDSRFGRAYRRGSVTVGIVVHSDSTISGHGPGVLSLLTSMSGHIAPFLDRSANLAQILGRRELPPARTYRPLAGSRRAPAVSSPKAIPAAGRTP
jgi:hypothetical protein